MTPQPGTSQPETTDASASGGPSTAEPGTSPLRLTAIRETPLSVDEALSAVADPAAGGTCVFIGTVRDLDEGRRVQTLRYEAHPSAATEIARVGVEVAREVPVTALAAIHRQGDLELGDIAVVVAVSAPHRQEAFQACRLYIDRLKHEVPIWKEQEFVDGGTQWVGSTDVG